MTRVCVLDDHFREDLEHWVSTDRKTAVRILKLMEAVLRDPFGGIGKPERLNHLDRDTWSRRITQEHRLVYHVADDRVTFLQALATRQQNRPSYRKKGYRPPVDSLQDILEHIRYERNMLEHTARNLKRLRPCICESEECRISYYANLESFLMHARNLSDFLYKSQNDNVSVADVLGRDFFSNPAEWHRKRPQSSHRQGNQNGLNHRVGKYLAHLSYDRIGTDVEPNVWNADSIRNEIVNALEIWESLAKGEHPNFNWEKFDL